MHLLRDRNEGPEITKNIPEQLSMMYSEGAPYMIQRAQEKEKFRPARIDRHLSDLSVFLQFSGGEKPCTHFIVFN